MSEVSPDAQNTPPIAQVPDTLNYQSSVHRANDTVWQDRGDVCAMDNAIFPSRCVKCNSEDGVTMKRKTFSWYPPLLSLLIFAGVIVFAIIVTILQKKSTVTYGVCKKHRQQHIIHVLTAWGVFLLCILFFAAAIGLQNGWLALLGVLAFFASIIYAIIAVPQLKAKRINDHKMIRLGRCGREFVVSLPGRVN